MMNFFYSSPFGNNAGKSLPKGLLLIGLLLIGFAMMVWVLREVFAFIAAGIFMIAGIGCISASIKAWLYNRGFKTTASQNENGFRKNVKIRSEEMEL